MFTWSENPIFDLWDHIMFYSNEMNCKKLLTGEIESGRGLIYTDNLVIDKKTNQIVMCIKQAYEYFKAANNVSINTSPLLLFYGMLSLAKALVVANKKDVYLEDIKYHGLETRPITNELRNYQKHPDIWEMEKEYAVTNDGVFKHLTEVINDSVFENGSIIRFKNLFSLCPEISGMFEKYYNEPSKVLYLYDYTLISKEPIKIKISFSGYQEEDVYVRIPELRNDFIIKSQELHNVAIEFVSKVLSSCPDYLSIYEPFVGGKYAIGGLEYQINGQCKKRKISQMSIDYIAMFILSICVRYKQDFWGSITTGDKTGVLGLIKLYINVVKRRYPNFFLNYITGENYEYGSPGYLM